MPGAEYVATVVLRKRPWGPQRRSESECLPPACLLPSLLCSNLGDSVLFYQVCGSGKARVKARALRREGRFNEPELETTTASPPMEILFSMQWILLRREAVSLFTRYFLMGQEETYL